MAQGDSTWRRWQRLLADEARELARVNHSDRPWEMPVAAALASGLPLFLAAASGELALGLVATLGAQVFLYLRPTSLAHRMAWLMACAFGMAGCYALGVAAQLFPPLVVPLCMAMTIAVTMICRFYAVPPPGSLFFIMALAIGAYSPAPGREALVHIGVFVAGSVGAVALAFAYSLHIVSRRGRPPAAAPVPAPDFDFVVLDSVVIGGFVALSLLLAELLRLERPYWVPISCLAVIQGVSLRAVWTRQLHRIAGTAVGLLVFLAIAQLPLNAWTVACVLTLLTLAIETLVVRHYGLAVAFITPLTILLAEAARLGEMAPQALMQARLLDTVVGALVGFVGGVGLHNDRFRAAVRTGLMKLRPGARR